ncbi:MAG TPA: anti-sigma factor [Acetobacteraceae bacterium]|nr:anti-sigma factor [Acetobacteraceae bacterium]
MSGSDRDMLAAEYVLGTLDGPELEEARRLVLADPDFAHAVRAWERRLAPLSRLAETADPPPDLWARIEARIGTPVLAPEAARLRGALRRWQLAAGVGLALAAVFAGLAFLRPAAPPEVVALAPVKPGAFLLALDRQGGALAIRPAAPVDAAPPDRDYELWTLPPGAKAPRSLGVLPPGGMRLASAIPPGTHLMVSLEPKGGSPTSAPTGPVLYDGVVQATSD